jgi:hypothetical protein
MLMVGKSQVLHAYAWVCSSLTLRKLEELVRDSLLRPRASRSQLEWMVPPTNHREPAPPKGYVVSFIAFHERGLGMPPIRFMKALLHYYGVELHHLAPTPSHRLPSLRQSTTGTWGWSPTRSYGSTSSRWSPLPRR